MYRILVISDDDVDFQDNQNCGRNANVHEVNKLSVILKFLNFSIVLVHDNGQKIKII